MATPEDIFNTENRLINNMPVINRLVSTQIDDSLQAQLYREYSIVSSESRDQGIIACPIATDGTDPTQPIVEIIQAYAPQAHRVVNMDMSKQSNPPAIPSPITATTFGDVLLSTAVSIPLPSIGMDNNTLDYSVHGQYVYIETQPRMPGVDSLPTGKYPFQLPVISQQLTSSMAQGDGGYTGSQSSFFQTAYLYTDSLLDPTFFFSDGIDVPVNKT